MLTWQNFKDYFDVRTFGRSAKLSSSTSSLTRTLRLRRWDQPNRRTACRTAAMLSRAAEETISIDLVFTQKPEEPQKIKNNLY